MPKVISMSPFRSKLVKSHLRRLSHVHLPSLYPDTLSPPSVTLGASTKGPKPTRNAPKITTFSLVHVQSGYFEAVRR